MLKDRYYETYTEAEIQFELGNELQKKGFDVYFERKFPVPDLGTTKRTGKIIEIRVDIVVVWKKKILCVIEVKNQMKASTTPKRRQLKKYQALGIPFFFCWNMSQIKEVLGKCQKIRAAVKGGVSS